MGKKLLFFLLAFVPLSMYSQCPDGVSAAISAHTDELCNGSCTGTATAAGSGGTSPYTYSWSPGGSTKASVTNLCAGTYTVTVTDKKGCTSTASVTVTQPTPILISIVNTNGSNCHSCNGTATVAASGGTSPYNYQWLTKGGNKAAATGLCEGNDTVVVTDANGCTASLVVFIDGVNLTPTIAVTNIKCNGGACAGKVSVTITGGNPPYTYAWSPTGGTNASATGLCVGTYSLNISDNLGCLFQINNASVTQPTAMTFTNYEVDDIGLPCNGIAAITPSGATPPYTYLWSGGQTKDTIKAQCPGTFCCTITDLNGCSSTNCVKVGLNSPLPITLTSFTATYLNQSNSVIIAWNVATQLNNKEFIIQKTQDGFYQDVATVAGGGTTSLPQSYSAIDYSPAPGTTYYRLEQIDVDENPTYFNPTAILPSAYILTRLTRMQL